MKSRVEAARYIESQMKFPYLPARLTHGHHYGWQHLRDLMDFIYGGYPNTEEECIVNPEPDKYEREERCCKKGL